MANFEQHVNTAVVASGILIVPLHTYGALNVTESFIALFLGLLGGLLPDLDSDNSKPIQIAFKLFSIAIPFLVLLSISKEMNIFEVLGIWVGATLVLHLVLFKIFLTLTVHRGIFHTIPMGILFAQLTIALFYYIFGMSLHFGAIAGFFILFGFLIHLLLDELISLNISGMSMKRSLGSAFKLYAKHNLYGTLALYIFITVGYMILPVEREVYFEIFEIIKNYKVV